MVTLERFYWTVGVLFVGFILFFWGATPQEARDYQPLRSASPDVVAQDVTSDAIGLDDSLVAPIASEVNYKGARVWFDPPEPLPGDTLRVVFASDISSSERAQILWLHNQIPVTTITGHRLLILEPSLYRKGHYVQAVVSAPGWQEEIGVRIRNRAPVVEAMGKPVQAGERFVLDVRGSDPEGDSIWLELPANSPGIEAAGMQILIDPQRVLEPRSVPVALTDGYNQTTFLLPLNPGQFSDYVPLPEAESAKARAKREDRQQRQRAYERLDGEPMRNED